MKMLNVLFGAAAGVVVTISVGAGVVAETDKCIVTNAWDKPSITQPRQASGPDTVWVALSCNAAVASPGLPGKVPPARKAVRR